MQKRTIKDSEATLSEVMMPMHANHYGSIHGGTILKLADEAAFVSATKYARKNVVVVSMDHIEFKQPVNVGDVLTLNACVLHVGRTSMDVEVEIKAEKLKEGKVVNVGFAYLTMVALDKEGKPTAVPPLYIETDAERTKNRYIKLRRQRRIKNLTEEPDILQH